MLRSIATVCLSGTLEDKLAAAAAARFDAVEIFENDLLCSFSRPREIRRRAADLGLSIPLYQPLREFDAVSEARFKVNLDRAERCFDIMEELGAPQVLLCTNVSPHAINDDGLVVDQLSRLAERADKRNLLIGYEALAWAPHIKTFGHAWEIVKKVDHPSLGLLLDSFHILSLGDDTDRIADILGEKIFFIQVADAPILQMDVLQWSRHFRCFPGQGSFDLAKFLENVLKTGYSGPISLEIFNDIFRARPSRDTAVDAMQSLLLLEEQTRRRIAGQTPASPTAQVLLNRVDLFEPPKPSPLRGLAFIEFAVDVNSQSNLAFVIETLGFVKRGTHRSKAVTLYQQGDITLILNAEWQSFAHSYYLAHGVSVCAVCLAVDDPIQALNRALSMHSKRYDGHIGPQEQRVPAIRSLDGSLIYFVAPEKVETLFYTDFIMEQPPTGHMPVLTTVDHLAQALPSADLDSWVLFYRAILGLEPGESWELADPYGLVRSRALASPKTPEHLNRAVRFPLNISQSTQTATSKTLSIQAGACVHHIAFGCDDIFATAETLLALGAAFLPIPDNYYNDLQNKFDLPSGLVERLSDGNILYDATTDGAFFHIYTTLFEGRFFFEIVQRVGNYDGYGAVNAGMRMAAQFHNQPAPDSTISELMLR